MMITKDQLRAAGATDYKKAASCLRVLGHPARLRVIDLLLQQQLTVGELADDLGIPSHVASTHLKLMQRCGFLDERREGKRTYYSVAEPHLSEILTCVRHRFSTSKRKQRS